MLGIATFGVLVYGLGLLYPVRAVSDDSEIGLRLTLGAALLILIVYVFTVLFGVGLRSAVALLGVLALLGWGRGIYNASLAGLLRWGTHPGFVLLLVGVVAVGAYGRIDYLPYLNDEFINWLGASRIIHWAGNYSAVRDTLELPGYTPGWRLLLLLPWQLAGEIDFGSSAAAPLVLHVAVLALLYDVVELVLRRDVRLPRRQAQLFSWAFLLLFLAAEGMGRLWTYELLIEQPQIYLLSAVALLILRADLFPEQRIPLYVAAGLVLAAAYLLKASALAALPAAGFVALLSLAGGAVEFRRRVRDFAVVALALLGPVLVTAASWSFEAPSGGECVGSPVLALLQSGIPAEYDPLDLARRFSSAVAAYFWGYKLALGLAATAGVAVGLRLGLFRAPLFWLVFAGAYFFALYLYHLTCFGPYYYQELNSIQRFARVPVQMFHTLGIVLLLAGAARLGSVPSFRFRTLVERRSVVALVAMVGIALAVWQVRQTYRTVVDVTTRVYQNADLRIAEMAKAAAFVSTRLSAAAPTRPSLAVLDQGEDSDLLNYALFFGRRPAPGGAALVFRLHPRTSWAPVPQNAWQVAASAPQLAQELGAMDVLWPVRVDEWLRSVLAGLVVDPGCLDALERSALVRDYNSAAPKFRCVDKDLKR